MNKENNVDVSALFVIQIIIHDIRNKIINVYSCLEAALFSCTYINKITFCMFLARILTAFQSGYVDSLF